MTTKPAGGGSGLPGAIRSEWVKMWSVRSTWWCILAALVLMALWAGVSGYDYSYEDTAHPAPTEPFPIGDTAVSGAQLAQFATMVLAMLVITAEYASGSIRSTLQCVPGRGRMLLSKTVVVAVVTFLLGLVLAAVGAASGNVMLKHLAAVDAADLAAQLPAIAGHLALTSLFTLGVGFAVRSAVATLGISLLILVVVPLLMRGVGVDLVETISNGLPGSAGIHLLDGDGEPYGRPAAAAILAGWAAASLLLGYVTLRERDA